MFYGVIATVVVAIYLISCVVRMRLVGPRGKGNSKKALDDEVYGFDSD